MNALLEGDVARVGVIGIGAAPDLRLARKRTRVGAIKLAPGALAAHRARVPGRHRGLGTAPSTRRSSGSGRGLHRGRRQGRVRRRLARAREDRRRAGTRAWPALCAGSELTGQYGLETRTVSGRRSTPRFARGRADRDLVERVLADAGLAVPLLVLRGDGGAMSVERFRRAPPDDRVGDRGRGGGGAAPSRDQKRDGGRMRGTTPTSRHQGRSPSPARRSG